MSCLVIESKAKQAALDYASEILDRSSVIIHRDPDGFAVVDKDAEDPKPPDDSYFPFNRVDFRRIKWFGMSWVGWVNRLFLQWLFIRLAYKEDNKGRKYDFGIMRGVWPTTGWNTPYRFLGE